MPRLWTGIFDGKPGSTVDEALQAPERAKRAEAGVQHGAASERSERAGVGSAFVPISEVLGAGRSGPSPASVPACERSEQALALTPTLKPKDFDDRYPPLAEPRPIFFEDLDQASKGWLVENNYLPRILFELPRVTEEDHRAYLMALSQGMAEGTIPVSHQRLKACELEMRARKMLLPREAPVTKTRLELTTEQLLDNFGKSRHGFNKTTMQQVEDLLGETR
jgi:hypothetical protein